MPVLIDVSLLLELVPEASLPVTDCVVIDALRASTTMLAALESGTPFLVPVETIEAARVVQGELGTACYLGGERQKLRPAGFHFGNSPLEYRQIADKLPVVYTTTNGTRALQRVAAGRRVLIGSLRNACAVAASLLSTGGPALLVCCGTNGQVALEDVLAAGAIICELQSRAVCELTDAARLALSAYQAVAAKLEEALLQSTSGQGLTELGLRSDVCYVAELNQSSLVPQLVDGKVVVR